jgi:hypothetical protein
MKRIIASIVLVFFITGETGPRLCATKNPALDILKVSAGVLGGIEAGHLLYLLIKKIVISRKKTELSIMSMKTNFPPPKSLDTVAMPRPDFAPPSFATNRFEIPFIVAVATNPPSVLSNLTPTERRDIDLFGRDYYYLVGIQYDKVKKPEKAKEYLLHSIALGLMETESRSYLKERFRMTDEEIRQGMRMYKRPNR